MSNRSFFVIKSNLVYYQCRSYKFNFYDNVLFRVIIGHTTFTIIFLCNGVIVCACLCIGNFVKCDITASIIFSGIFSFWIRILKDKCKFLILKFSSFKFLSCLKCQLSRSDARLNVFVDESLTLHIGYSDSSYTVFRGDINGIAVSHLCLFFIYNDVAVIICLCSNNYISGVREIIFDSRIYSRFLFHLICILTGFSNFYFTKCDASVCFISSSHSLSQWTAWDCECELTILKHRSPVSSFLPTILILVGSGCL